MDHSEIKYPIYLDYQSTTPVDPRVVEVMLPYLSDIFGNPASKTHQHGHDALAAVENSRKQIAKVIKAKPQEIIFTSGATEAINLAIKGIAFACMGKGGHFITVATEHKAVLDCHSWLNRNGFETTILPVNSLGMLDPNDVAKSIRPDTLLVSVMTANNEIGVIQPISEIGKICREHEVYFFTDATQAYGKIPLDVNASHIDMLCASAHKIYGPKGIGMLYVRRSNPRVKLEPIIHGGGHEGGLRSGTLATHQIVGFGVAGELSGLAMKQESQYFRRITQEILDQLRSKIPNLKLNGHPDLRLSNNLNFSLGGANADAIVSAIRHKVSLSTGSACTSKEVLPSHVLSALGCSANELKSSIRLSVGRGINPKETEAATDEIINSHRRISSF